MTLVARLRLVLADPDLVAELVAEHLRRHACVLRRKLAALLAAQEEDVRLEGLPFLPVEAVDEQVLALTDDVLLAAELDDRVGAHDVENAGWGPRSRNSSCSPWARSVSNRPSRQQASSCGSARPASRGASSSSGGAVPLPRSPRGFPRRRRRRPPPRPRARLARPREPVRPQEPAVRARRRSSRR